MLQVLSVAESLACAGSVRSTYRTQEKYPVMLQRVMERLRQRSCFSLVVTSKAPVGGFTSHGVARLSAPVSPFLGAAQCVDMLTDFMLDWEGRQKHVFFTRINHNFKYIINLWLWRAFAGDCRLLPKISSEPHLSWMPSSELPIRKCSQFAFVPKRVHPTTEGRHYGIR